LRVTYSMTGREPTGAVERLTTTGAETCLAPRGETMSFAPQWSPDGRYLAYYTATGKKGNTDPYNKYDIISGEDAPLPIAAAIQIASQR